LVEGSRSLIANQHRVLIKEGFTPKSNRGKIILMKNEIKTGLLILGGILFFGIFIIFSKIFGVIFNLIFSWIF